LNFEDGQDQTKSKSSIKLNFGPQKKKKSFLIWDENKSAVYVLSSTLVGWAIWVLSMG